MSIGPSSLDMIGMNGILPFDCNEFIYGQPSPYLQNEMIGTYLPNVQRANLSPPQNDSFQPAAPPVNVPDRPLAGWKIATAIGLVGLVTTAVITKTANPLKMFEKISKGGAEKLKQGLNWATDTAKSLWNKVFKK